MHSNNYTLGFVFIVTLILGTMLSYTKDSVKVLQEQNLKADVQKTILRSLNFDESLLLTNESIEQTFKNSIDAKCVNVEGEIVECNIEEVDIEKNVETIDKMIINSIKVKPLLSFNLCILINCFSRLCLTLNPN